MVTIAKDDNGSAKNLPIDPWAGDGEGAAMTVARALTLDCLAGATVVAGHAGLGHEITRVNVMEVPDILPWVQPDELLLTTGYAFRHDPDYLTALLPELKARGLAGLAIKLRRYIDELPEAILASADELDFPLITLAETAAFDGIIYGVLSSVVNPQVSMLERAEAMLRTVLDVVLRGGDLEEICRRLVANGYPVALITNAEGEVIAEAGVNPAALSAAHELPCFDRSGRFKVRDESTGLRHGRAKTPDESHRLVARVRAGALDHGRLVVFGGRRLTAVDLHLLERSAEAAALVITKNQAIVAVESKYRADFLWGVIAGTAGSAEQVVRHARSTGWELAGPVALAVAELERPTGDAMAVAQAHVQQDRFAAAWAQAVKARLPGAAVAGRGHEVVVVVPADPARTVEELTRVLSDTARTVRRAGGKLPEFSTGLSRVVPSVEQLPQAYAQARTAVSVGRQMQGGYSLVQFDALGVYRLLSLIGDSQELRSFVTETLGELAKPTADAADLRETLTALLDNNLNVAETARQLHFHYNSLRYRISKLEHLLGPFTRDPHARLTLELALRVHQMRT